MERAAMAWRRLGLGLLWLGAGVEVVPAPSRHPCGFPDGPFGN